MIKKILTGLGKLAPSFLHSLDNKLIVQHPLLWSLRLHYVIYYNALVVCAFTAIVYAIPIAPLGAYNLMYISYISLGLSIFSMGLWLYAQNQYNVQKSHGICGPFFNLKYALLVFIILVIFVSAACTPVWLASQRTYTKLVGEDIINFINHQPYNAFDDYWDEQVQRHDFVRYLPDRFTIQREIENNPTLQQDNPQTDMIILDQALKQAKSENERAAILKELERAHFLKEQSESLPDKGNLFFRALYNTYFRKDPADIRNEDLTAIPGNKITFQGKTFSRYWLVQYDYAARLVYKDEAGNLYFANSLIYTAFIDRLLRLGLPEINAEPENILQGEVVVTDQQLAKFIAIYSIIIEPPWLYTLIAEFSHENYGWLVLLSLILPCLLTIMLVITTANLFGTRAFFVDTTSSIAFCIFILTLILAADNSYDINDEMFIIIISAVVFSLSILANIFLRKCLRLRKGVTFLWQLSTFCIPVSLLFGVLIFLDEFTDIRIEQEFALGSILSLCVLTPLVLFPMQFRLAHKLFALPR